MSDLPVVVTMSFDTAGRSMMGVTGTALGELAVRLKLDAVGANCGNNLADTEAALVQMQAVSPDLNLIFKGNAGLPVWKGTDLHYTGTPDMMAAYADRARGMGVALIGACCGSSPEHLAKMRRVLDGTDPVPDVELSEATEQAAAKGRSGRRRRSQT